ncbi:unnamed protein product [Parnassius apollo]|uniref:(apollo) hypothetical protein n=1 Tax=Parnassius apollo TaxID=110799 RepID=A0A8S3WCS3_PARAO|nr:unnamed protein product [Parnassius apollo]
MDRFMNSNIDQQTIYEIYRACRLCGAGAGYKMPIIQNVVDLDGRDVELKQKIRECVQIEVNLDDKMPPLICELCVDKVNDFYEFFEMCRQTNKRTRQRLGLPPQTSHRGAAEAGDCILGVTEPVYVSENSKEPLSKQKSKVQKGKTKKESEVKIKNEVPESRRESRSSSRSSAVPETRRATRGSFSSSPANSSIRTRQLEAKRPIEMKGRKVAPPLKSILKKEKEVNVKVEDKNLSLRSKRQREKETVKQELPSKRVKIAVKPTPKAAPKAAPKPIPKPIPKPPPRKLLRRDLKPTKRPRSPSPQKECKVCGRKFHTSQSLSNHSRSHPAAQTQTKQVKKERGVSFSDGRAQRGSEEKYFTDNCFKCGRSYLSRKSLLKHESACTAKKKEGPGGPKFRGFSSVGASAAAAEAALDPEIAGKLRPVQIRVARCDPLLAEQHTCSTSTVPQEFGLDSNCVYPYISSVRSLRIKSEPGSENDGMVEIKDDVRIDFDLDANYIHWDSDCSSDSEAEPTLNLVINPYAKKKKVKRLSTLTLKTIFSEKILGKVPRKRRKVKLESSSENIESRVNTDEVDVTIQSLDSSDDSELRSSRENEKSSIGDENINKEGEESNAAESAAEKSRSDGEEGSTTGEKVIENAEKTTDESSIREETCTKETADSASTNVESCQESVKIDEKQAIDEKMENINEETSGLSQVLISNISSQLDGNNGVLESEKVSENNSEVQDVETTKDDNIISEIETETKNDAEENIAEENATTEVKQEEKESEEAQTQDVSNELFQGSDNYSNMKAATTPDEEANGKMVNESTENNSVDDMQDSNIDDSADNKMDVMDEDSNYQNEIRETEKDLEAIQKSEDEDRLEKSIQDKIYSDSVANASESTDLKSHEEVNHRAEELHDNKIQDKESSGHVEPAVNTDNQESREEVTEICNNIKNVNGQTDKQRYKLNMDDLDDISDTEMDDRKLLEALDAQIGEGDSKEEKGTDKDKITLEDLLPDKASDIKPMDLDSIADEFSFDP